jgi:DNA polymerase-3 subunit delta
VKISPQNLEKFIQSLKKTEQVGCLIFGFNSGGVSNISERIAKEIVADLNDPFLVTNISSKDLNSENTTILYDEAMSIPFMGGKKLILLKNIEGKNDCDVIVETLKTLPEDVHKNCFILITAADLQTTNSLRKHFEYTANVSAIPCYEEDERGIEAKVKGYFYKNNIRAENGVIEFICDNCSGDTKIIENLLLKISLFLGEDKNLNLDDLKTLSGFTSDTEIQEIIDLFIQGKKADYEFKIRQAQEEGIAEIAIIRTMQRYFEKLHLCLDKINEGANIDEAISSLKPPLFYKIVPQFRANLMKFSKNKEAIWRLYQKLLYAEASLKETGADNYMILSRLAFKNH